VDNGNTGIHAYAHRNVQWTEGNWMDQVKVSVIAADLCWTRFSSCSNKKKIILNPVLKNEYMYIQKYATLRWKLWNYTCSGSHINELSSMNKLHEYESCRRPRTNEQSFISITLVYSASIDSILMIICEVQYMTRRRRFTIDCLCVLFFGDCVKCPPQRIIRQRNTGENRRR
jgi:hypothetical protein